MGIGPVEPECLYKMPLHTVILNLISMCTENVIHCWFSRGVKGSNGNGNTTQLGTEREMLVNRNSYH